ncbi:unnamed protein product [Phyllotreta striolata]|uniref:RAD50-interacting protein 1 n=1 Tax=Phyllotreta striolata TaxID=444603 RepID=A0A9N9XPD0_PHYSR|nr:unnamed protein product [Phyllotreta striolata]
MHFEKDVEIKRKVIQNLNEKHIKDLLDLGKCTKLYEELSQKKEEIEKQLNISERESIVGKAVREGELLIENGRDAVNRTDETISTIQNDLDEIQEVRSDIKNYFDKLNTLQCTLQYLKILQQVDYLNNELYKEVGKKDDEKCATLFVNLTEICRNLADFAGQHLKNYLKDDIFYWHNILKENLSKDFNEIIKAIKWPFVSENFTLVLPFTNQIQKLQIVSEYLLQIEIPPECAHPLVTTALLSNFPPICLPVHLLLQPLKKRFLYHFYGARQTNRVDKPEWYLTQILTWIRDHKDFVDKYIQPVADRLGLLHIETKLEFIRGLVQIAVEKLHSELPNLQFDDFTFSHSIDEALGFDKELRETYEYPANQPSVLVVLTQPQIFIKWLSMEKKYATEKMDSMLSPNAVDAFDPLTSDVENLKITNCADAFITLLQTITERYESLPQPGHRLQFLDLQLELLDDFRVRLLQLVNAEEGSDIIESIIPSIANSIYYVENVLIDWGATLHYLSLYYYKNQASDKQLSTPALADFDDNNPDYDIETDTVFAETMSLYMHMRKDLLHTLAETVIVEVRSRSKAYRCDNWLTMKVNKEFRSLSLTPTACSMFEVLSKRLHQLQKSLQGKLFTFVWRSIAQQLDSYLFEDLVLDNRFSEGGALQFKFDIVRNLIPLFLQFSQKPQNYFTQVIESCNLLNLSKGSALLLRETLLALEGATGVEDTRGKVLQEIGVTYFTPKMAVRILNQRADITVNRILID